MDFAYLSTAAAEQWSRWLGRNVEVSNDTLRLTTEPSIDYSNLRVSASDITIDRDGSIIMLMPSGDIHQYNQAEETDELLWENGAGETAADPRSVCAVGNHVYVADGETGDLILVSQRTGMATGRLTAGLDHPIDIIRSHRRVFVLDGGSNGATGRVLAIQPNGPIETAVYGLEKPTDIAADSSHLYILEQPDETPRIRIHDVGHLDTPNILPTSRTIESLVNPVTDEPVIPICLEVLTDQELVVIGRSADSEETALYHYVFEGPEGFLEHRDTFPIECEKLKSGPRDRDRRFPKSYAIAGPQNHVYIIDERQTYRLHPEDNRYSGQAYRRLDTGAVDAGWNRLTLHLESFPANTQVVTRYFATNDRTGGISLESIDGPTEEDLQTAGVKDLWDLIQRDTEEIADRLDTSIDDVEEWLPSVIASIDEARWHHAGVANQRDILLENVSGRYLFVKLELVGSVDASPEVGTFRAYCPDQSYLRYLPEYYRKNGRKGRFLEQFLSVFESEFVDIEEEIERVTQYFDPDGIPNEYVSWLAEWLSIEYDDAWPVGAKRAYLRQAPTLFRLRGTRAGILRTIQIYLDHIAAPSTAWITDWEQRRLAARHAAGRIDENRLERLQGEIVDRTEGYSDGHLLFMIEHLDLDDITNVDARVPYTMHMDGPQSFVVYAGPFVRDAHRRAVERIVAEERPAHTDGRVVELRQELKLEGGSFLGINSTLTSREFVLGRSTLGGDSVLRERETFA